MVWLCWYFIACRLVGQYESEDSEGCHVRSASNCRQWVVFSTSDDHRSPHHPNSTTIMTRSAEEAIAAMMVTCWRLSESDRLSIRLIVD